MKFRLATGRDHADWDGFVSEFAHAEFSHSFRMKALYENVYKYETAYWIGEDAKTITLLLYWMHLYSP